VILEDDAFDAELIEHELGKSHLKTDTLCHVRGRDEFEQALAQSPDVILADFALPGYDAWAALETAQQHELDSPFIVVSGALGEETAVDLIKHGADDYLLKDRLVRLPTAIEQAVDRRRVEREKRAAEQSLRQSEQRYRRIVETSVEGIWLLDENRRITFANRRMAEMLGHAYQSMVGTFFERFAAAEDRCELETRFDRGRAGQKTQDDVRLRTADDTLLWTHVSLSPTFDARGEFNGALVMAGDITARKQAEEALRAAASYDSLTNLVNRSLFLERLGEALQKARAGCERAFGVLFLDVDRFKEINDTLGHCCGDQLLTTIAARLSATLRGDHEGHVDRADATLARVGGDEFTALLTDLTSTEDASTVAERLQRALSEPVTVDGREVTTTVSIGIAVYGSHYETPEQVLRDADTALYAAKAKGDGRYAVWDQRMQDHARRQFELGQQIHRALEADELELWYQPIMHLNTDEPVGCEALMRWRQAERGLVSPAEFIPLAEETGAIVPMGLWAIRRACHQIQTWDEQFDASTPLYLSVNISPRQLAQSNFPEKVAAILHETGVPAHRVKFEITESAVIEETGASKQVLHELSELGIQLYMDDFGTGYSSLSHLYELPIDVLKIDRSFTMVIDRSAKQRSIVRSIIGLAQNLGIPTIAEGIETTDHTGRLLSKGCHYGQGFLYSPPLEGERASQWLAEHLPVRYQSRRPNSAA
jgi:diguanylate cyclase (GGDEF)-like protein/PAS domain S-box-containing protein